MMNQESALTVVPPKHLNGEEAPMALKRKSLNDDHLVKNV
jgi:hypothetical protein